MIISKLEYTEDKTLDVTVRTEYVAERKINQGLQPCLDHNIKETTLCFPKQQIKQEEIDILLEVFNTNKDATEIVNHLLKKV